jgi:peptidylprolyl isomerase
MKNTVFPVVIAILFTVTAAAQVPQTPPDVAAPPEDAACTDSGLCSKVQVAGSGEEHPNAWDKVTVHYFNRVIPGWTEGLQLMVEGEIRRLWIPTELAYNDQPGRPAGTLVFDVQLISIENQPEPPPPPTTPEDVAAPPADAEVTKSGLASKVLRPGVGQSQPKRSSTVTVHYSGWTTDGKLFDSSVARGEPTTFPLNRVIPGWTEGLQLMVVGERRRFWIPEKLAYKGAAGAPKGMLVFDVELISFE